MSGFTPGPWTYDVDASEILSGSEASGWIWIADVAYSVPTGETQANARLIAAAPDLLEALRALRAKLAALESPLIDMCAVAAIHGFEWTAGDWVRELEAADEAIAKAECR